MPMGRRRVARYHAVRPRKSAPAAKAFNPVGVGHVFHILADRVVYALVGKAHRFQQIIALVVIGNDCCPGGDV